MTYCKTANNHRVTMRYRFEAMGNSAVLRILSDEGLRVMPNQRLLQNSA